MVEFDVIEIQEKNSLKEILRSTLKDHLKISGRSVLKITFFSGCTTNSSFLPLKDFFLSGVISTFNEINRPVPCISIVAQESLYDSFCSVEIIYFDDYAGNYKIEFKQSEHVRYCILSSEIDNFLFTSCTPFFSLANNAKAETIFDQVDLAFKSIEDVLIKEGFSFSDVVRQWTYIEDVLGLEEFEIGVKQFYQIYNDVRSSFFDKYNFENGYMAATGIGSFAGIITTEVIAYKRKSMNGFFVAPVKNPKQINPYEYSEGKLIGTPLRGFLKKTTPKFERGKLLYDDNRNKLLFLSGTSSVVGENSIYEDEIFKQIETTVNNIEQVLISATQIANADISLSFDDVRLLRVYLGNKVDVLPIKLFLKAKFPNAKLLFLLASICRDDLSVEIEGVVQN